jgi:hypothetical protein
MIDLAKLEREIDQLLEVETADSLLSWLYEKRISDLKKRVGQGVFDISGLNEVYEHIKISSKVLMVESTSSQFITFCDEDCSLFIPAA